MSYSLDNFGRRFWDSIKYVNYIAYLLQCAGVGVILPPARVRKENESRMPFVKTTDLYAFLDNRRKVPIEVKSKKDEWTTPDTWPFEDVTLFNANKTIEPFAVVFVSQVTRVPLVVVRDGTWYPSTQADNDPDRHGLRYDVLSAPLASLLSWDDFVTRLRAELTGEAQLSTSLRPAISP